MIKRLMAYVRFRYDCFWYWRKHLPGAIRWGVALLLPRKIKYLCTIIVWAEASASDRFRSTEVGRITVCQALDVWEGKKPQDDDPIPV